MKLMNNLMKSILAIAMIAAMSACSMGGVTGTNASAANTNAKLQIAIDTGRTFLPANVAEILQEEGTFHLYCYNLEDKDNSCDFYGIGLAALNQNLAGTSFAIGEQWEFSMRIDRQDIYWNTISQGIEIRAGVNTLTFTIDANNIGALYNDDETHMPIYGSGKILSTIEDATVDVYQIADEWWNNGPNKGDKVGTILCDQSMDVTSDSYILEIRKAGVTETEFAIVLGGFTTIVDKVISNKIEIDLSEPSSSEALTPSSSEETNVSSSDVSDDTSSAADSSDTDSSDASDDSNSEADSSDTDSSDASSADSSEASSADSSEADSSEASSEDSSLDDNSSSEADKAFAGFEINYKPNDIKLTVNGTVLTASFDGFDAEDFTWYVDGFRVADESASLDAADPENGATTGSVIVVTATAANGLTFSATAIVK